MNRFRVLATIYTVLFINFLAMAQGVNPHKEGHGNNARRYNRRCTEPFPVRSFNRDYASMSNTSYYHLNKELKDYVEHRCLTSDQIRRLALLYPTDREKYDFLVYSLTYVFDIENYALSGNVLANRNARDGFYRFLVREGIPAGDYYSDPYYAQGGYYTPPVVVTPTPQYYDRWGNPYNRNNNYDNRNNNSTDYYNNPNNNYSYPSNQESGGLNSGYRGMLSYKEFEILKDKIKRNTFDKGKLEDAKMLTKDNRLTANQIADIARLFNYDSNRLEYAKYAFDYAYDRENYVVVSEAMSFDVNRKDLMRYVESFRR